MQIERIRIQNFKIYQNLDLTDLNMNNIVVGNNGSGKTTLLQALYLALTGRLDGQPIEHYINANLFTKATREKFISDVNDGKKTILPKIIIEVYFKDEDELAKFKGQENYLNVDSPGILLEISFDSKFDDDYQDRLNISSDSNEIDFLIRDLPTEYYGVTRRYFNGDLVIQRKNPFKVFFVDGTKKNYANYIGRFVYNNLTSMLSNSEISQIRSVYSSVRQNLKNSPVLADLNDKKKESLILANSQISMTVRESLPEDWLSEITVNVNEHPFDNIGFGLQKMIEMELAVEKNSDIDGILLFEEPENNLSYSNMSKLISLIDKNVNQQKFISTHSSFVANKIGLDDLLLCENSIISPFNSIPTGSFRYFKKLPGYNTLRLLLSGKPVLVEGPTDELVFNKAFMDKTGDFPINQGIDVIVVDSLAFKRYLDVAAKVDKNICVVIDNDGDISALKRRYVKYIDNPSIHLFYEKNESLNTLEPSFIEAHRNAGQLDRLKQILGKTDIGTVEELSSYMSSHKAEWALRLFDSDETAVYPGYISDAVEYVRNE